ncbi:MAG TPA: methylamine utilization protein [Steroidobacteraceae bacterium]|jgi:plastocyanin
MRPPARLQACLLTLLAFPAAFLCAAPAGAATLAIHVQSVDGNAVAGAVITARPLEGGAKHPVPMHALMDQINRAFAPDLLVVPVGSTVSFPNSDSVSHQIYSFSSAKRFQLPLYRGTPYPPVLFDQPGVITLGCNIHDEMLAYLVVTDAPYFGRTDATGSWSVELGPGRYRVTIWHPRLHAEAADLEREFTVGSDDRAEFTIRLAKPLQPAPLDRAHSWDY